MKEYPYRLMWDEQCIEAYPNQHTVIASCDPQGRYYDMWRTNQIGKVYIIELIAFYLINTTFYNRQVSTRFVVINYHNVNSSVYLL